jgi:hypothetical protein
VAPNLSVSATSATSAGIWVLRPRTSVTAAHSGLSSRPHIHPSQAAPPPRAPYPDLRPSQARVSCSYLRSRNRRPVNSRMREVQSIVAEEHLIVYEQRRHTTPRITACLSFSASNSPILTLDASDQSFSASMSRPSKTVFRQLRWSDHRRLPKESRTELCGHSRRCPVPAPPHLREREAYRFISQHPSPAKVPRSERMEFDSAWPTCQHRHPRSAPSAGT